MKKTTDFNQLPPHLYSKLIIKSNITDNQIIKKKIVIIIKDKSDD